MKKEIFAIIFIAFSGWSIIDFSQGQAQGAAKDDLQLSTEESILLFTIAVLIVIGIVIYMAREIIIRKKTRYDKGKFDSKKNRDYEKYHSDWHDDSYEPGAEFKKNFDPEFQEAVEDAKLQNYYEILGINSDASQDEIKTRFRELVKEVHPDKSKEESAEEKMAEINKAYEVLSDVERRKKYDRYLNVS